MPFPEPLGQFKQHIDTKYYFVKEIQDFFHMKEMMKDHADLTGRWLGNCEETVLVLIFKNLLPQNHVFMLSAEWTLLLANKEKVSGTNSNPVLHGIFLKIILISNKKNKPSL